MSLVIGDSVFSCSGNLFARAIERELSVFRDGNEVDRTRLPSPVQWLEISADATTVLAWLERGRQIWRWCDGAGDKPFLQREERGASISCGFLMVSGSSIILASKNGMLQGIAKDGATLFSNQLQSPHSFVPRQFVQLDETRLAMTGAFFSDPCDVAVCVDIPALLRGGDAIQQALKLKSPLWDRAPALSLGSGDGAMVVLRDPEDNELEDDGEGELWNFKGAYLLDLKTGALVEKHAYQGAAGSGVGMAAGKNWIAIQTVGGVDLIHRASSAIKHIAGGVLDANGRRICVVQHGRPGASSHIDSTSL